MDKNAAFDALSATWHVFPPMQLFIVRREALVRCATMQNFDGMFEALQTLRDACTTAHVQVMCRRLETLADNRLLFPDPAPKGINGFHQHNGANRSNVQQLRAILRG